MSIVYNDIERWVLELVQADFRRVIRVGDVGESKVCEHANIVVIWLTVRNFFASADGIEVDLIGTGIEELCACNDAIDDIVARQVGDNLTVVVWIFVAGTTIVEECWSTEYAVAVLDTVIAGVSITDPTAIEEITAVTDTGTVECSGAIWVTIIGRVDVGADAFGNASTIIDDGIITTIIEDMREVVASVAVCNTRWKPRVTTNTLRTIIKKGSAPGITTAIDCAWFKARGASNTDVACIAVCTATGKSGAVGLARR